MDNEILIHSEEDLRAKIYTIRGLKVMLDADLAEIYGYSVKAFNQQVKNNIERFDEDFRFQLTDNEVEEVSRCKLCTLNMKNDDLRSKFLTANISSMSRSRPYAFTEQGIYMLMTVLRGELAVRQSKMLVRLFKQMKDYIVQRQALLPEIDLVKLSLQTSENTKAIQDLKKNVVTRDELTYVIKDFTDPNIKRDYLFFNGETVEADIVYSTIYSSAKKTIFVVDNYIGLKTLVLLKSAKSDVQITVFSDNVGKGLHASEFSDFCKEYPNINVSLKKTNGIYHDRYIMIDFGTTNEKIYHCGGSSKDCGVRIMSISQVEDVKIYKQIAVDLQKNPVLVL